MVWNQLKRCVARESPRTKEELKQCIIGFWNREMTVDKCCAYIDHVYKVVPVCVMMRGHATGDVPKKVFSERSKGKSLNYFHGQLTKDPDESKASALLKQWI